MKIVNGEIQNFQSKKKNSKDGTDSKKKIIVKMGRSRTNNKYVLRDVLDIEFTRGIYNRFFNIYDKLASYDNEIRLSNEGLKGTGTIEFYTSSAISDDITNFYYCDYK